MKVEMGESLCYSYLRHVKRCWLVQTNWKSSERWKKYRSDEDLETMYRTMKEKFDRSGEVFKKTKDAGQFMKQGEVDVVGVDPEGGVHALDVAFHEAGLLYGGGNDNRILKKLLRTYMLLHAYRPAGTRFHIYFVSPRVHVGPQKELEATFRALQAEYPEVRWCLMTNDDFAEQVVRATLDETSDVADTAELFVRAAKLMSLSGRWTRAGTSDHGIPRPAAENARERMTQGAGVTDKTDRQIQPLVRALMTTLLVDHRTLLGESDRCNLMDADYCKRLGLKLGFPLLRKKEEGREVNGHDRYWKDPCDGFYVCSQWWKDHHVSNARHLVDFMQDIARKNPGHPGMPALQIHMEALRNFAR